MVNKYLCSKCGKKSAIRYGNFKLKNGKLIQRLRCQYCKRTTSQSNQTSIFDRARVTNDEIHKAIMLYTKGKTIQYIANRLNKRPNTITDWIKKCCEHLPKYKTYLEKRSRFHSTYPYKAEKEAIEYLKVFLNKIMNRVTRLKKKNIKIKFSKILVNRQDRYSNY